MKYIYGQKKEKNQGILSATRPRDTVLKVESNYETQLKTILRQKKKITIYEENKKYFVEHATAYALGLINVRAIMLDNPKLIEINYDMHNKLCKNDEIEIDYILLESKKQKLRVFFDGSSYYIENSAAFALGLLTVEEFSNINETYYCIMESMLTFLEKKYDIEMCSVKLFEETQKKHK